MNTPEQHSLNGSEAQTAQNSDGDLTGHKTSFNSSETPPKRGKAAFRDLVEQSHEEKPEQADDTGPDSPGVDDTAADSGTDTAAEVTLASLAELAGLTETELYDKLKINTGDGESVTLAGAKERLRDTAEALQGIASREAEVSQLQAKYVGDVQALGVLDALQAVPEGIRQQANQHLMQTAQKEADNFRLLHPQYKNDDAWNNFTHDVDQMLKPYGLSSLHFGVRSLGMYRLMADMIGFEKDAKAYRQPKPKPAPTKAKPGRAKPQSSGDSVTLRGTPRNKFGQVAAHLNK